MHATTATRSDVDSVHNVPESVIRESVENDHANAMQSWSAFVWSLTRTVTTVATALAMVAGLALYLVPDKEPPCGSVSAGSWCTECVRVRVHAEPLAATSSCRDWALWMWAISQRGVIMFSRKLLTSMDRHLSTGWRGNDRSRSRIVVAPQPTDARVFTGNLEESTQYHFKHQRWHATHRGREEGERCRERQRQAQAHTSGVRQRERSSKSAQGMHPSIHAAGVWQPDSMTGSSAALREQQRPHRRK